MDARYKELLANLKTSTTGDKVIIDHAELRVFLYNVNELITAVKAEAGRAGYHEALQEHSGATTSAEDYQLADQYAARVRQDEQSGTWLKDSNVNGGKRQGGE